ncbi:MAG: hypothetical protein ABSF47_00340 [Minisyncoccia bacterium]|jgi:hypothetical protein
MDQANKNKVLTIDEAAAILSETLEEVTQRKTSLRRAMTISRLALALAKVAEIKDLKDRVEFLEQALKKRK